MKKPILSRRAALALLLLVFLHRGQAQSVSPEKPLHFLVMDDWGTLCTQQKQVADAMARYAATPGFAALKMTPTELRGEFVDADLKSLDIWKRAPASAIIP